MTVDAGLSLALSGVLRDAYFVPTVTFAVFLLAVICACAALAFACCSCTSRGTPCVPYLVAETRVSPFKAVPFVGRLLRSPLLLAAAVPTWVFSSVAGVSLDYMLWTWSCFGTLTDYGAISARLSKQGADALSVNQWIQAVALAFWALVSLFEAGALIWLLSRHSKLMGLFEKHNYYPPPSPLPSPMPSPPASPAQSPRASVTVATVSTAAGATEPQQAAGTEGSDATAAAPAAEASTAPKKAKLTPREVAAKRKEAKARKAAREAAARDQKRFLHLALDHRAASFWCVVATTKAIFIVTFFGFGGLYLELLQTRGFSPDTILVWGLMISLFVYCLFVSVLSLAVLIYTSREEDFDDNAFETHEYEYDDASSSYLTTERAASARSFEGAAAGGASYPLPSSSVTVDVHGTPQIGSSRASFVELEMTLGTERNYLPPGSYSPHHYHHQHPPIVAVPMLQLPGNASHHPHHAPHGGAIMFAAGGGLISPPASAPPSTPSVVPLMSSHSTAHMMSPAQYAAMSPGMHVVPQGYAFTPEQQHHVHPHTGAFHFESPAHSHNPNPHDVVGQAQPAEQDHSEDVVAAAFRQHDHHEDGASSPAPPPLRKQSADAASMGEMPGPGGGDSESRPAEAAAPGQGNHTHGRSAFDLDNDPRPLRTTKAGSQRIIKGGTRFIGRHPSKSPRNGRR